MRPWILTMAYVKVLPFSSNLFAVSNHVSVVLTLFTAARRMFNTSIFNKPSQVIRSRLFGIPRAGTVKFYLMSY